MQKKFKIEVDCANCAAKIETAIKALPGVKNASVSFMAQKLLLEADDDKFDAVLKDAVRSPRRSSPISRSSCKFCHKAAHPADGRFLYPKRRLPS